MLKEGKGVLCLYIWFFALLICCFETHLAQVSRIIGENFGFLYNVKGRVTFFVLVSFLCFSIGLIGLISGVGLLVAGALVGVRGCRFCSGAAPGWEWRRFELAGGGR